MANGALQAAGHEIKVNSPRILARTRRKFGKKRALAQKRAIMFEKARATGAKV